MKNEKNYNGLTIMQYISSLLVILIHCGQIVSHDPSHFVIKNIVARVAVPFFLILNGFFYETYVKDKENNRKEYYKKMIRQYLLLSFLYLPYAFYYFKTLELSNSMMPIALLVGLFYTGTCYHLWYYPALLLGTRVVEFLRKRHRYVIFGVLLVLYLFGSLETYSGLIMNTPLHGLYIAYKKVFFTTRNGLFFTPIFIYLGMRLTNKVPKYINTKLLISFIVLCLEGYVVYNFPGDDKNFLLSLVPFSYYFTFFILNLDVKISVPPIIRYLAWTNFIIHPFFIEILNYSAGPSLGILLFIKTFVLTTFVGVLLYNVKNFYLIRTTSHTYVPLLSSE